MNTYGYAFQNSLRWADVLGLKPGDLFATKDEAAVDAIEYTWKKYPGLKKGESLPEAGGWIYNVGNCYTYVEPIVGTQPDVMNIDNFSPVPKGSSPRGYYHTHSSGLRGLSKFDAMTGNSNNVSGYAGYYDGSIFGGDPTGTPWDMEMSNEREISDILPEPLSPNDCRCQQ